MRRVSLACGPAHHPAALVLALGLQIENALGFQLRKGKVPEFEVEDLAFAGEKIVFNAQAQHGFKVPAQDGGRNQIGDLRNLVAAGLYGMQGFQTDLLSLLLLLRVCFIPLRDPRIEVPAVIVNALPLCFEIGQQLLDAGQIETLEVG